MTRFGLDSSSEVPIAAHHAVGSSVALRYLSRSTGKVITHQEHLRYRAAGIDLVLVFEDGARNALAGYDQGKSDAQFAILQANRILGAAPRRPVIRFAADFDPAGNPQATDAYYDGIAAVLPRADCGPYGSDQIVAHQHARGFGRLWQTYAWSGGRFYSNPANSVYQYSNGHTVGGVGVDFNHLFGHDFGQWDYQPPPPSDPHHYGRLTNEHYAWKGRLLPRERPTVIEYDRLRRHPLIHRARLAVLRKDMRDQADRICFLARSTRPPTWGVWHRGWRYQQLAKRAAGQKIV